MPPRNTKSTLPKKKGITTKKPPKQSLPQTPPNHTESNGPGEIEGEHTPLLMSQSLPEYSPTLGKIAAALRKFQQSNLLYVKDSQGYGYQYLSLGMLIEGIMPELGKCGLSVTQFPHSCGTLVGVYTILMHDSGEYIGHGFSFTLPKMKGVNSAQQAGSAITYARRYALSSILGIVAENDTDGR